MLWPRFQNAEICSYVRSSTSAEVLASPQAGRSPIATWQAKMQAAWLVVDMAQAT